jgi:hypothetical protein
LSPDDRRVWLRDFRRTYLERDPADLGRVVSRVMWKSAERIFRLVYSTLLTRPA